MLGAVAVAGGWPRLGVAGLPIWAVLALPGLALLYALLGAAFLLTYRFMDLHTPGGDGALVRVLVRLYVASLVVASIGVWWMVLSHESQEQSERELERIARAELGRVEENQGAVAANLLSEKRRVAIGARAEAQQKAIELESVRAGLDAKRKQIDILEQGDTSDSRERGILDSARGAMA